MTEVKTAGLIFICFSLLHGYVAALNCTSPTPESLFDALERELFPKKLLRPVKTFSDTLNITVDITLVGILGVNEKAQSLTTFIWQILEWDIEGLSWDEKECGTKRVSVPREKLWVPDVSISEFMDEDKSPKTPFVYLYNTGRVFDDKPVRVVSSCQLEIYTFPFDIQNCSLTFGPHLHHASDIKMIQGDTAEAVLAESRKVMQTKGEWELADIKVTPNTLEITEGSYSDITFYIILRRRPILYVVNLLIPSCFLMTLDLFSFLLPPASVDRSAFKMTLILGYTVFLLIMNDLLPVTGDTTPLMNVLFSVSLALMVASLLETVFITNIQFSSSQYNAVPHWLSVLVLRYLAIAVCLPPREKSNRVTVSLRPLATDNAMNNSIISSRNLESISGDTPLDKPPPDMALDELRKLSRDLMSIRLQMDHHFQGTKTSQEWQMIGVVIDRLLFGLYIIFISVSFITIVSIWIWNHSLED
ncbi:5-hydroxytryptamine receptor 3A-like [Seriola lalandi dorsalis]|uniref:5-hydroxytryptamine receptor 3A-like n=1 Tax=Seriola lalandi dorsalis TaxID=1841481 RepID=UPI000C6F5A16|nr:5-hydroxytryptamine receptor 3A-like [Seriola lalandi dorsalis]XP_056234595.1 5-hydroxytryptamine receptor 3A-like [Seriola aureovittata]